MVTGESDAAALDEARKAVELIGKYRSPTDARAFAVWQTYARGSDRALCAAVDEFISQKQSLNHDDIDFIHRAFLEDRKPGQEAQQLSAALIKEVDRILEAVELATGSASRYNHSLKQISHRLQDDVDVPSLQQIIKNLSEISRQTIADNEALTLNLEAMRVEIDNLRNTLQVTRTQSLTDDLTKLSNRRHLDAMLPRLLDGVKRRRDTFGVLMLDIDFFKRFNDEYGHQTGDQVLRLVATTIKKHMPPNATAARYGGEEFVVLLPDHELFQVMRVAELIRTELRGRDLVKRTSGKSLGRVTISCGVAEADPRDTAASLIHRADRCLSAAKMRGRDCTVSEQELVSESPGRRAAI